MSLETVIATNTAAIQQLIAVWTKLAEQTAHVGAALAEPTPTLAPVVSTVALPAIESPQNHGSAAIESPTETAIEYETVSKAITTTVKTDRTKVLATLAQFGVAKGPELIPEQYAAFIEALAA